MAKIALIGDSTTDGGVLTQNPPCHVKIGGVEIALDQCHVTPHNPTNSIHGQQANNLVTASGKVTIKGIKVVMHGDPATCGATAVATSKASTS